MLEKETNRMFMKPRWRKGGRWAYHMGSRLGTTICNEPVDSIVGPQVIGFRRIRIVEADTLCFPHLSRSSRNKVVDFGVPLVNFEATFVDCSMMLIDVFCCYGGKGFTSR